LTRWQVLYGVRADQCPFCMQRDWNAGRGRFHRSAGEGCNCVRRMSAVGDEAPAGNTLPRPRRCPQADSLEGRHGPGVPWSMGDEVASGRLPVQRSEPEQLHSCLNAPQDQRYCSMTTSSFSHFSPKCVFELGVISVMGGIGFNPLNRVTTISALSLSNYSLFFSGWGGGGCSCTVLMDLCGS